MLAAAIIATQGGCAQVSNWVKGGGTTEPNDPVILGAPQAETYLQEIYELAVGDPATQAEIFADAQSGAMLTPGPNTHLRLALVAATPGHPEFNPEKAQRLLREILAQAELLTPAEISLATIHLNNLEQVIVAHSEARRLRASDSRSAQSEGKAVNQRLATVEAENRRLREQLAEAEGKLEAITTIETIDTRTGLGCSDVLAAPDK